MKSRWFCVWHAAILAVLICIFLRWALPQLNATPYFYDEADYMFVAEHSAAANYLDVPSQSLAQFIHMGLTQGGDPAQRGALSEFIRASGDMNFYRHWHGPLYYFWLKAVTERERASAENGHAQSSAQTDVNHERREPFFVRRWFVVFPIVTVFAIYFGSLWIFAAPVNLPVAILSSTLFLWSYPVGRSNELAPHSLYVLWYVLALIVLAKLTTIPPYANDVSRARRYWYAAVAITAIAFATMEISFTLVATLLVVAWCERRNLRPDRAWATRSVLLFIGVAAALWPMGVLRLNVVKSYLFMAYLAVFRHNAWGDVTLAETWRLRLTGSPVEWLVIALALILFRYRRDRAAFPALVYSLLTLAAMFRVNTDTPRYLLPFLPALHLFAGFVLADRVARWRPPVRAAAVAGLVVLLWANTARQTAAHPPHVNPRPQALLNSVRENHLQERTLLVPNDDLPALHYYFPQAIARSYTTLAPPENAAADSREATLLRSYPIRWLLPGQRGETGGIK